MSPKNLLKRLEKAEESAKTLSKSPVTEFDEDALAIYSAMSYLDATMDPTYHDVEATAVYRRGYELRNEIYGPIIPANLDERLRRYTRASGEFELVFGREPVAGDALRYDHVKLAHSTQNYSRQFGHIAGAWNRQLPRLICPLKFEDGHLFRRVRNEKRAEGPTWKEDIAIRPEERWLSIPEVLATVDFESMTAISAVVFLGVVGIKHGCRVATEEEFRQAKFESPGSEPAGFLFGQQRFKDFLVEVMGA